jgi:adenylosuccinate lyase
VTASTEVWSSPLAERYASRAMLELWSPDRRYGMWRRLWLALAEAQQALGVAIPEAALAEMRAHLDDIDYERVAHYERRFKHDVMAHVYAFGEVAPAARPFIHLGATSAFVTDNADLILMREGLLLLRSRLLRLLRALVDFARRWRDQPVLGYTHLQPAQVTTVGKRATLWIYDFLLDLRELDRVAKSLPLRGVKGTTGTQASFLELFAGDHEKVRELERRVVAALGFESAVPVAGQTYTRKLDTMVMDAVAGVAASASKWSGDIRVLQSFGELSEPHESEQVGSSAMAYKRNPMRSERIAALARFVLSLRESAPHTHAVQFLERTLDDSAARRLYIPEVFLATDAILLLALTVARGLQVHVPIIERRLAAELPFMATEALLVRAVQAGGDRQEVHEIIRRHSMATARDMRERGTPNDLLERLASDPRFPLRGDLLQEFLRPERFYGRAPQQVDEFLEEHVEPSLAAFAEAAALPDEEPAV